MVRILSLLKYTANKIPSLKGVRLAPPHTSPVKIQSELPADTVVFQRFRPKHQTSISESALTRGIKHITGSSAEDSRALQPIIEECFVGIKTPTSAIRIFRRQGTELRPDRAIYILNPSSLEKLAREMGTSNSYMSELYKRANHTGTIIDRTNASQIAENIIKNGEKKITIVVPDDFAGSGRSMIVNTAETLKNIDIPKDVEIELILSPMCATPYAKKAFKMFEKFDGDELMKNGVLNKDKLPGKNADNYLNDSEIIRNFTEKYKDRMTIRTSSHIITAKPYNETNAYIKLKETNPDAAQAIDILMTEHGKGYGRPGSCGTIVLVPGRGNILKTPNNNCYGALPFILEEGGTIGKIKNPNQKWSAKKWEFYVKKMAKELGVI